MDEQSKRVFLTGFPGKFVWRFPVDHVGEDKSNYLRAVADGKQDVII